MKTFKLPKQAPKIILLVLTILFLVLPLLTDGFSTATQAKPFAGSLDKTEPVPEPTVTTKQVCDTCVLIFNVTDKPVMFFLRNRGKSWENYGLGPKKDQEYHKDEINLRTNEQYYVQYNLESGKRYVIFWNGRYLDLKKIGN